MKKKLISILLIISTIFLIIYFQSCKRETIKDFSNLSAIEKNDTLFASLTTAISIAENVNKSNIVLKTINKTVLKSTKFVGKRTIKNSLTIFDKELRNPYFYVLNYESGGFAIIPADKRIMPILAYIDKGSFNIDNMPLGLRKWFEVNASYIKHLRASNTPQSTLVQAQWTYAQCDASLMKSTQQLPCPPPPPGNSETTVTVGPLLTTTWNQDCGYNSECPIAPDGECGHAYTGCVATSIAQVMAYWKYPTTYNWNNMPSDYGNYDVAVLMKDVGTAVGMIYGGNGDHPGSSPEHNGQEAPALRDFFNYSSASFGNYDVSSYNTVIANLNNHQPVILSGCSDDINILEFKFSYGNCHSWVCDGYMQTTYYVNGQETSQYLSFYMNWGWGGTYNGWFAFNDWHLTNGWDFKYADEMVYNIHP